MLVHEEKKLLKVEVPPNSQHLQSHMYFHVYDL